MKIHHVVTVVVAIGVVVLLLTGCGSGHRVATPTTPSSTTASPTPTSASPTEDPNLAACDAAHETILKVKDAIATWNTKTNLFDQTVAAKLRNDATELFSEEVDATGSVKEAIHAEADGLVKLSIALEGSDPISTDVGTAADASNVALAQLRGVCKF